MRKKWIPLIIVGIAAFVFIGGEVVMQLWNWLLPGLFGWPQIGFWQGLGLLTLCRILFGGLGCGGGPRSRIRRHMGERWEWEKMTPEERERLRQGMRSRCGFGPAANAEEKA